MVNVLHATEASHGFILVPYKIPTIPKNLQEFFSTEMRLGDSNPRPASLTSVPLTTRLTPRWGTGRCFFPPTDTNDHCNAALYIHCKCFNCYKT